MTAIAANPAPRVIVEAAVHLAAHIRSTKAHWQQADSTTGFELLDDGGVRLTDTTVTKIENATSDGYFTDLDGPPSYPAASPFQVATIEWNGTEDPHFVIDRVVAYLHPQQNGGNPKTVSKWVCQLFAAAALHPLAGGGGAYELAPLASPVLMDAAGTSPGEVTFSWVGQPTKPRPKSVAIRYTDPLASAGQFRTFVFIWAIRSDGAPADNVGWGKDSAQTSVSLNLTTLHGAQTILSEQLVEWLGPEGGGGRVVWLYTEATAHLPRLRIETGTYAVKTLLFTTSPFDLGVVPTNTVEFVAEAEIPGGTSAVCEVLNDAGTAWVPFLDGQTTDELAGVGKRQTYKLRATLTPPASGDATPTLRALGVREVKLTDFRNLATAEARWAVDPVTLKGEIPECTIRAIRDGERDYRDAITTLLSENDIGSIHFRLWWGADDLEKSSWLRLDDFLVDDYDPRGAEIVITGVSPLALIRQLLPKFSVDERVDLPYRNVTLKAAYDDLLDNQVALPARYRGPGIEQTSETVTKIIPGSTGNADTQAKDELDALCYLAGGALISSQGRVRFVDFHGPKAVVQVFRPEEVAMVSAAPGFRQRVPEFFVPWRYDFLHRRFEDEVRTFHGNALTKLGVARVDPPQRLAETIAQWISTSTLAETIGTRVVTTLGTGLLLWRFRTIYPWPELELGDCVAVPTDRFVAKDPNAARSLRGALWALGLICECDSSGRNFAIWIRSYADIGASTATLVEAEQPPWIHAQIGFERFRTALGTHQPWEFTGSYAKPGATQAAGPAIPLVAELLPNELPHGKRVTGFLTRYYLDDAGGTSGWIISTLRRAPHDGGAIVTLANLTADDDSGGWQTDEQTLNHTIDWTVNRYYLEVAMLAFTSGPTDNARFMWNGLRLAD